MTTRALVAVVVVLCAVNAFAQSAIPAEGLAAEQAGNWAQARDIYKASLEREPHDAALWARVADIEAHLGNLEGNVAALRHAIDEAPNDATLHQRLSQGYALLGQPSAALEAIERAVALSPSSVDFLRARATLATWLPDYGRAQDSYRRLLQLQPENHELALSLARVSAWGGRSDAAVDAYRRYLQHEPGAAAVWIELARTEGWRGNYGAALAALDQYRQLAGPDGAFARESAAVLARAGRPDKALDTLQPMLRQQPDDYELNLTRTIALTMQRRSREAANALEDVQRLQPDARDTHEAERVVRATMASAADPGVSVYGDSSGLSVQRVTPRATIALSTGTSLAAGSTHEMLTAPIGSGLEQVGGNPDARHDQLWVSAEQQAGVFNLRGRVGQSRVATRSLTAYAIGAGVAPFDGLKFSVERSFGFFVMSPRTVGLGLDVVGHRGQVDWSPTIGSHVAVDVLHQSLSDGNRRWEFTVAPRRSFARTERLNLDLGVVVSQMGTTRNLDNGYYDPQRYEYYAAAAYPYFKVRESIGLGLSLAAGVQRDDLSPTFRFGGNATAEATFGIYDPWGLKVSGGGIFNQRLGNGAFSGYGASVSVIRRF
ncbi:MAG TPA: tetratricopeptide repeat protein [Vicinamibacterales bacterium]|nr:tetratricopeptide repeat protein [Vicinamibacterales bacterium]